MARSSPGGGRPGRRGRVTTSAPVAMLWIMDAKLVSRVLAAFEDAGVEYKVFGGVAVNIHGVVRGTLDLDIFVAPTAANVGRLRAALRSVWDDPSIEEITFEDLAGPYPAIQYVPPTGDFHIDILTRLGDAYSFATLESQRARFGDLSIPVVSPRQLYEMKRGTVRYKDAVDAYHLKLKFGMED